MERLRHNHADDTSELLSAYVDNALDMLERRRAEAQTQSCSACAQELRDLRMFKTLLHELPDVSRPRSFTLDPATAVGPRRLLFPTLRLATMVASLLFFVVLSVDALGLGSGPVAPSASTGSQAVQNAPSAAESRKLDFGTSGAGTSGGAAPESAAVAASAAASTAPAAPAVVAPGASAAAAAPAAPEAALGVAAPTETAAEPQTAAGAEPEASPAAEAMAGAATTLTDPAAANPATAAGDAAAPAPPDVPESQSDTFSAAPSLAANQPLSPDTIGVQQSAAPADDSAALSALRIAEIGLGLIALALGAGAVWAWRQQR